MGFFIAYSKEVRLIGRLYKPSFGRGRKFSEVFFSYSSRLKSVGKSGIVRKPPQGCKFF
jgi:hypothetical protein